MAFIIADRVKETSTTTGTGALALAGAMTGFQSFSAKCAEGDTLYYALQAVDAGGAPSGDWECGLGTYSATNTLTRTTVTSSSNAGAVVNLSAGSKQVFLSMPAVQAAWARERLTADRTYYVATTGSDSNNGLTVGTPFLTIQKAVDVVCGTLDIGINAVTIQLADGTYTAGAIVNPTVGTGVFTIKGNTGTPANTVIITSTTACIKATNGAVVTVIDLKLTSAGSYGVQTDKMSILNYGNIDFGACVMHIYANTTSQIWAISNYKISGSAAFHWLADFGALLLCYGKTITLTGTPAFGNSFAKSAFLSTVYVAGNTYSGSATGKRYYSTSGSIISSDTTLPGSISGTVDGGGQYI